MNATFQTIVRLASILCLLALAGCFDDAPQPDNDAPASDSARRISLTAVGTDNRYDATTGVETAESSLPRTPQFIIRTTDAKLKTSAGTVAIVFERFNDSEILDPHWRLIFYDRYAARRVGFDSPFALTVIQDGRELWTPNPSPGRGLTGHRFVPGRYRASLSFATPDGVTDQARLEFRVN
ncbi:MAG: hypothetical protein ABIH86_06830 [Planctomycetota bacterium]